MEGQGPGPKLLRGGGGGNVSALFIGISGGGTTNYKDKKTLRQRPNRAVVQLPTDKSQCDPIWPTGEGVVESALCLQDALASLQQGCTSVAP